MPRSASCLHSPPLDEDNDQTLCRTCGHDLRAPTDEEKARRAYLAARQAGYRLTGRALSDLLDIVWAPGQGRPRRSPTVEAEIEAWSAALRQKEGGVDGA